MMMLIAVAYALIYGLIGRINLAFGELAALGGQGAVVGAAAALSLGMQSAATGLVSAAVFGVGVAAFHGRVIERLVVDAARLRPRPKHSRRHYRPGYRPAGIHAARAGPADALGLA